MKSNYYVNSFAWTTIAKVLNALLNFISIPLLIKYFGVENYGILSLAIASNAYMHLLDLGINTGAIKFYAQWKIDGKYDLRERVVRTSITFYSIIALINSLILLGLAFWGNNLFNITPEQFNMLRVCFIILVVFSFANWLTTVFNQLIIAEKEMAYTQKILCIQYIAKFLLIFVAIYTGMSLFVYFLCFTCIVAFILIPYVYFCKKNKYIESLKPLFCWGDFKIVFNYSLAIFLLSIFQITATQSRPIILAAMADNAASVVAEYKIVEVFAVFLLSLGSSISPILLPKSSECIVKNDLVGVKKIAYEGTKLTTILAHVICIPILLCSNEILSLYVGPEYTRLSIWLALWCVTLIIQIHSTPGNSLILAKGKLKSIIYVSAFACLLSIGINCSLCNVFGVGSAVIGYFVYVAIVISSYYIFYYKKVLSTDRLKYFMSFLRPSIASVVAVLLVYFQPFHFDHYLTSAIYKTSLYFILFFGLLLLFRIFKISELRAFLKK